MKINEIIIKPVLTEKATNLVRAMVYMFEVNSKATKTMVKTAIEKIFQVKVGQVKVVNRKGKKRRVGRTNKTKMTPARKMVYVKLIKGKIDLFPQT